MKYVSEYEVSCTFFRIGLFKKTKTKKRVRVVLNCLVSCVSEKYKRLLICMKDIPNTCNHI